MLQILFVVILFVSHSIADTQIKTEIKEGNCGGNCQWKYDSATTTLTITGNGTMTSFYSLQSIPWKEYRSTVTSIVFSEKIQNVGQWLSNTWRS